MEIYFKIRDFETADDGLTKEWIETAEELGRPIPIPKGKLMYA